MNPQRDGRFPRAGRDAKAVAKIEQIVTGEPKAADEEGEREKSRRHHAGLMLVMNCR